LRLDDEGFHPTVLVYWRNRLRASDRPRRIFEAVREVVAATRVLTGRGRRVLDSTVLEDAVATQDTVTQLVAASGPGSWRLLAGSPTAGARPRIHPHEEEFRAARRRATARGFQQSYRRWRPMVERSIAWLVADGCRQVPYRGIESNNVWWSVRVTAVNLRRLPVLGLAHQHGEWVLA
jgi:Transposase DDE domain